MTIYTSHWQLKQWPQGYTRVSISRGNPRWLPAGSYKTFRALAPGKWFNSVSPREYLDLYNAEILGKLDPRRVVEELEALGPNPTMLCWEGPKGIEAGTHWCHRHIAAQWLEDTLGIQVEELKHPKQSRFRYLRWQNVKPPSYGKRPPQDLLDLNARQLTP
jgi:hypothetical protein